MRKKIGRVSGNVRIDTSTFEEPDSDTERVRARWLERKREIPIKNKLKRWRKLISNHTNLEDLIIHLVGQSHIDIAWMWRYLQTSKKAQVTFRKAVLHAKMFPETFCFALSEPLLLEWVKEDNPKLFSQIQKTVNAGGIELVGGSYVEPDCMMPSGETFIRQRLYGMRFYRDNFGVLPTIEWFLDSFGYNRGLPQILAKSGAKYFWTTKMTWNLQTTFPFVNFWWQSPDGTRILTSNFDMDTLPLEQWNKYQVGRHLLKKDGKKVWDYSMDYNKLNEHVEDKICPHVGIFFGKSDGGHGPTHKEVAHANEYAKESMFKWSRVENYFKELDKYSDRFPVWNDELYLENHRGCFSNHLEVKRHNRKYENLIASLESLAILTMLTNPNYQYPVENLENLWKITFKNQFHDILPGSAIPEVYDDVWDDWDTQNAIIEEIIDNIGISLSEGEANKLNDSIAEIYLYNPVSWRRTSKVFIPTNIFKNKPKLDKEGKPNYAKLTLLSDSSEEYICQPIAEKSESEDSSAGWYCVVSLDPLSSNPVKINVLNDKETLELSNKTNFVVSENFISNNLMSINLDSKTGAIIELLVKGINDDNNLLKGCNSNLTYGFLDDDKIYPAWNLTLEFWNHPLDFSNEINVELKIVELGPIFTTLEITRSLGISPVSQKITLFHDLPELFLEYSSDWKQENTMLKVLYSTSTNAKVAVADAAYSAIKFKTVPEVPCDKARFEKIQHKYIDLSTPDNKWGLAMLNEGKYAFDVNGDEMRLTMLRSCKYPDPAPEAWVNEERMVNEKENGHKVPEYSGLGPFKCKYALLPHNGGTLLNADGTPNVVVKRKAEEFNMPVIIIPTECIQPSREGIAKSGKPLLEILTPNVYLGALKLNEWNRTRDIIVRFIEGSGIPASAKVKFNLELSEKISEIKATDLLERDIDYKFEWNKDSNVLSFDIGKFEICTFKLKTF